MESLTYIHVTFFYKTILTKNKSTIKHLTVTNLIVLSVKIKISKNVKSIHIKRLSGNVLIFLILLVINIFSSFFLYVKNWTLRSRLN